MRRPSALQFVSWLFIVSGLWAAVSIAGALLIERRIDLDIELLGLWIGPGLLRHEARYRTWGMRVLIFGFCVAPIGTVLLIFQPQPLEVKVFGHPVGTMPLPIALTILAFLVGVAVWQYWVLSQTDVRALFSAPPVEDPKAPYPPTNADADEGFIEL